MQSAKPRLPMTHLAVAKDSTPATYTCGSNPHFVASVADGQGKVIRYGAEMIAGVLIQTDSASLSLRFRVVQSKICGAVCDFVACLDEQRKLFKFLVKTGEDSNLQPADWETAQGQLRCGAITRYPVDFLRQYRRFPALRLSYQSLPILMECGHKIGPCRATPWSGRTAPGPITEVQPCVAGLRRKGSEKLSWITTQNDLSWRHASQDRETNT
jgi:hypothetical protein